MSSFCKMRI